MPVRHTFESPVVDAGDPTIVGPDEWNDDHVGGEGSGPGYWRLDSEFFSATTPWADGAVPSVLNGTGSAIANANSEVAHPGVISMSTGTSTTGRAALAASSAMGPFLGGGAIRAGVVLQTPSALSDGTNRYTVWAGPFGISTGAAPSTGMGFTYIDNVNSGNWTVISNTSGSDSSVDTGVAVATSTWYTLEVEINAAATEALFYINGTLEHTETTNIETATALVFVPVGIFKSLGGTNRFINVDAFWVEQVLTTPR